MRRGLVVLVAAAITVGLSNLTKGQSPQSSPTAPRQTEMRPTSDRVLGEVTAVEPVNKKISMRSETGKQITVIVDDQTLYRRIPPGETNVEKATVINFPDIAVGDRVLARGKLDGDNIQTRILLVVSSSDLARSAEQSRLEWQRRGISGTIESLDPATKEIMVRMRTALGAFPIRLTASGNDVRFKRYAPNSRRYKDVVPSTFDQLKVGDFVRALGDRSQDGTSFKPEEIVAGQFRMAGGVITEVNQLTGEVKIKDIQTRQPLTIIVSKDSMLRRLPAELLARMEQSMEAAALAQTGGVQEMRVTTASGQPGIRRIVMPGSVPQNQQGQTGQRSSSNPAAPAGQGSNAGGPGGPIRRMRIPEGASPGSTGVNEDYHETIANLPPINIGDLKPGDGVIVSSTSGGDPARVKGIIIAAGVTDFLKRLEEARNARPGYELDLALPGLGAQ